MNKLLETYINDQRWLLRCAISHLEDYLALSQVNSALAVGGNIDGILRDLRVEYDRRYR
jgi:ABC-type tungstate transport system substrate-binding protein